MIDPFETQDGIVARRQVLAAGMSPAAVRHRLTTGRWQTLDAGVYATFTGPVPPRARVWAAVLRAGEGAVAGPRASLWLADPRTALPPALDVAVPHHRRVTMTRQVEVWRLCRLDGMRQPGAAPPRLRVEEAVLELCGRSERPAAVTDLVIRVTQRRLTTAARLGAALADRRGHPWRGLLEDTLADVRQGVRSPLENRWLRCVERMHRLPASTMDAHEQEDGPRGRRSRYRDVVFVQWGLVVELDGREAHPDDGAFRDRRRDNRVLVGGRHTLRYGWHEIAEDACGVAAEVAAVLRNLGWAGRALPCGPRCTAAA